MASLKYWVWLTSLEGISSQLQMRLLDHFGDPEHIYYGDEEEYFLVEGMTRPAAQTLGDKSLRIADRILGDCQRLGLRIMTIRDTDYPERLRNIFDPPLVLYVQGQLPVFDEEAVIAMVGSRSASSYSLESGERLAYELASQGAVIVSGLAAGGDAAAHRGALRAGGRTVAVIAGGHDIKYPWENRFLYEDIAVRGGILSEYPPGTQHKGFHFPVRNRIISGLSLGVVVMEAPEKSGTLITASRALDQGRDVFVVPGRFRDPACLGSNRLIRDGAGIVTESWDVLGEYAAQYPHKLKDLRPPELRRPVEQRDPAEKPKPAPQREAEEPKAPREEKPILDLTGDHDLTDDQVLVVRAIGDRTIQVDELIEAAGIPARRVLSALTMLEIDTIVTQTSGKYFSLNVTLR